MYILKFWNSVGVFALIWFCWHYKYSYCFRKSPLICSQEFWRAYPNWILLMSFYCITVCIITMPNGNIFINIFEIAPCFTSLEIAINILRSLTNLLISFIEQVIPLWGVFGTTGYNNWDNLVRYFWYNRIYLDFTLMINLLFQGVPPVDKRKLQGRSVWLLAVHTRILECTARESIRHHGRLHQHNIMNSSHFLIA